jgi:hypothetical protein
VLLVFWQVRIICFASLARHFLLWDVALLLVATGAGGIDETGQVGTLLYSGFAGATCSHDSNVCLFVPTQVGCRKLNEASSVVQ